MSAAQRLRAMIDGHQMTMALSVAASLGIADLVADGCRSSDELAEATGSDPDALYRLLRALAALGVLREDEARGFALAELGEPLRSGTTGSLRDWAIFSGRAYYREAWTALGESIRTGENAFRLVHGVDSWEYRAARPEESALFDRAMAGNTRVATEALLEAFDFGRFETLVDVGGGNGELLRALLAADPRLRVVLFDQPHVVAGVDLGPRGSAVGGSFFEGVPPGGDAYLLKWILHDWEDEDTVRILRGIARHDATLLVVERVLGPPNEGAEAKQMDLNMLVGPGGRERTLDEFRELFAAAGFRLAGQTPTRTGLSVLEGERV